MRLLQHTAGGFSPTKDFVGDDIIPPYAILSHTWGDEEFTYRDLIDGTGATKAGWDKIRFSGQQAERYGLQYFWIDTCCIDKSNLVELQEAINSMFRWYQNAIRCYVYLSDVSAATRRTIPPDSPGSRLFAQAGGLPGVGHFRSFLRHAQSNSSRRRAIGWETKRRSSGKSMR